MFFKAIISFFKLIGGFIVKALTSIAVPVVVEKAISKTIERTVDVVSNHVPEDVVETVLSSAAEKVTSLSSIGNKTFPVILREQVVLQAARRAAMKVVAKAGDIVVHTDLTKNNKGYKVYGAQVLKPKIQ